MNRLRAALVVVEITGTVVLLVGAGLLLKALWHVQAIDPGFRAEGVLTLRTALPSPKFKVPVLSHKWEEARHANAGTQSGAYHCCT